MQALWKQTNRLKLYQAAIIVIAKFAPRLADGAKPLAAPLFEHPEHVIDPSAYPDNAWVASLLAVGQRLVALALPRDRAAESVLLEPSFGRIAPVSINVAVRVPSIEHFVEVLAIMHADCVSLDLADRSCIVLLVAEVALAVLLRLGGVDDLTAA